MGQLEIDAVEALRLATVAPARAIALARKVERAAVRARDPESRSIAARARGVAALQLRDLVAAAAALRVAIRAADRAGVPHLAGEARMSLAATLGIRGLPDRAIAEIDLALRDLDGLPAARARTQRAAILQARGRDEEALLELRRAVPVLRRHDDVEWQTRALSNRGLLQVGRRAFGSAEADLRAALELCERHGLEVPAAYADQNLGCVLAGRGDLVGALAHFDSAAARYRSVGLQVGSLWLDRGDVLLSLRLVSEARAAAESAVRIHLDQQRRLHVPEARLLLSTAALVDGDVSTALAEADQAAREFRSLHRPEGVALAHYARLQALAARNRAAVEPARARRCAVELAAAGWSLPALEARVLAGRLALDRGRRADARRDLTVAARARAAGPADARARAWYAEALLREASGRRRATLAALSTGLRVVEEHQQTLGATELRAHVSVHGGTLARAGLRHALAGGDARAVLQWAERGRASAMLLRSPAPPADPALARDLADLRTTMTEIADARAARRPTATLVARQTELERAVASRTWTVPAADRRSADGRAPGGRRTPAVAAAAELGEALDTTGSAGAALVEYVAVDDALSAVSVVGGRVRLHRLGGLGTVRADLDHLAFALSRLADPRSRTGSSAAARTVLARVSSRLDALLLGPLLRQIGDRALVVAPTGPLQSLPWSVLPSCAGRPVSVSPSATVWLRAHRSDRGRPVAPGAAVPVPAAAVPVPAAAVPVPAAAPGVAAIAGPGLPGAEAEAAAVADLYPGAALLTRSAATVEAVCAALDGARVAHIAAHGRLRADNPLFSSLLLADGPLVVHDLQRLRTAPEHVVLAACESARSAVLAGDETLGLAAALLHQGTPSLVAPLLAVPDAQTAPLMLAHHHRLLAGLPPAEALAAAQQSVARDSPSGDAAAAVASAFICLGDGLVPLS